MKHKKVSYSNQDSFRASPKSMPEVMFDLYAGPLNIETRRPLNGMIGRRADLVQIAGDMYRAFGALNEKTKIKKAS